jgi:hypothetical protein
MIGHLTNDLTGGGRRPTGKRMAKNTPLILQMKYAVQVWGVTSPGMLWGASAGDSTTVTSNGPGYIYANSDPTNMYNRPSPWSPVNAAMDVTQASRSLVWLNNLPSSGGTDNDFIVVYDRASTVHSGLFGEFNLALVNAPVTQSANGVTTATETMNDGQQLFIQTLLPQNAATNYFNGAVPMDPIAELEPTRFIYQVQYPTKPSGTRFLHVLQGADPGAPIAAATYLAEQ